jgi:hypothetical protein
VGGGLGYVIGEVEHLVGSSQFTVGYGGADTAKAPVTFAGLDFTPEPVTTRAMSLVAPVLLFPLALALFRRFDPARTRSLGGGRRSLGPILAMVARPVGRPALVLLDRLSPAAALTFRARPPLVLFAVAAAALGVALPTGAVRQGLLPALLSLGLAGDAPRPGGLAGGDGRRRHVGRGGPSGALHPRGVSPPRRAGACGIAVTADYNGGWPPRRRW